MKKRGLKSLIASICAIVICTAMLLGTTFAWFTDSISSEGNKIVSGSLKVDLELLGDNGWDSIKEDKTALFNYDKWEPGYTEVKILKVENEGTLALKWKAKILAEGNFSALADVIDVYVLPSATEIGYPADRNLDGYEKVGTVREFANTIEDTTKGELAEGEVAYLGIALKMQNVGNEYQGLDLTGAFDIQIVATQLSAEDDSFSNDYDSEASLDWTPVSSVKQLNTAIENKAENVFLTNDIAIEEAFAFDADINIDGQGYTIYRKAPASGASTFSTVAPEVYKGVMFTVKAGTTLELSNVIIDGGAVWTGDVDEVLGRGTVNSGVVATGALVSVEANAEFILGEGAVLQNNDGASTINTPRGGSVFTINGGEIINNNGGAAGAIYGGGEIIMEAGKISGNSGGIGAVLRSLDAQGKYNISFTVNGGEISHNSAGTSGGVIWSGNGLKAYFNGGEIAYNHANTAGGVIWGGSSDQYFITGDVKIHDNSAGELGNAFRFNHYKYPAITMTGGHIYNNNANGIDAIYAINDSMSLTGGVIDDNMLYSGGVGLIMGNVQMNGIVKYDLSTNHNTAYLDKEFNAFKFTVNEAGENFAYFNFKPAEGYVYTEGDEAKLVCMNDGYVTYWDTTTATFRLQAK